jgi:centromeric protein E
MELQAEVTHLKEQLSQALEAKDLLSKSVQNNRVVNHEVEHHADQESAVSREVSSELLQKQQQVCFHFFYNCFCVPRERSFELLNKNSSSDCSFLLNK